MSENTFLTTRLVDGDSKLEIDEAEITVVGGPDKGLNIALGTDSLLIGSSSECDVVLHDRAVSGKHAELVVNAKGYAIRDLGSTNGLWIGTVPIERARLMDGMHIRLGSSLLAVKTMGRKRSVALHDPGRFGGLIAHSVKMRALTTTLAQIAASDATVLVEGETGTGKEVTAQSIHSASPRALGPFVVFDCGAVPPALIAAELFGHAKGAYTGATAGNAGLLAEAEGGTLFLDEVGELPMEIQPMLLGAIERKSSRRVGGQTAVKHDVRFIAATNRNLEELVREGQFRKDLYFRLAVARVRLPPLRERPEDVPILAEQFAGEVGLSISVAVRALLSAHDWPGNVRELKNMISSMLASPDALPDLIGNRSDRIGATAQVPGQFGSITNPSGELFPLSDLRRMVSDELEIQYLKELLARAHGNVTKAAQLASVTRQYLGRIMAKHGIQGR